LQRRKAPGQGRDGMFGSGLALRYFR